MLFASSLNPFYLIATASTQQKIPSATVALIAVTSVSYFFLF